MKVCRAALPPLPPPHPAPQLGAGTETWVTPDWRVGPVSCRRQEVFSLGSPHDSYFSEAGIEARGRQVTHTSLESDQIQVRALPGWSGSEATALFRYIAL